MLPEVLKSISLPEGYNFFYTDSCVVPDYRAFSPKHWCVLSKIYVSATIDLEKRTVSVKDNRLLSLFEGFGLKQGFEVKFEKSDPREYINRHVGTTRQLFKC